MPETRDLVSPEYHVLPEADHVVPENRYGMFVGPYALSSGAYKMSGVHNALSPEPGDDLSTTGDGLFRQPSAH